MPLTFKCREGTCTEHWECLIARKNKEDYLNRLYYGNTKVTDGISKEKV